MSNVSPLTGAETVSKIAEEAVPQIKNAYRDVEKRFNHALQSMNSTIQRYPMAAIAFGFGLGCLTGLLAKVAAKRVTH